MRIGAVNYLNSKPLVCGLETLAPEVRVTYDLPSRLADSLAAGRLDVALVPSVEFFRTPGYRIVSDACVACRGPVLSVKLYFRVPPNDVRRVALDEGSRTSSALTQILLAEMCGVWPRWETLPIGCGVDATDADAVLLIGDRAMVSGEQGAGSGEFCDVWDLGERWCHWTGLPFVFAMWIARPDVDVSEVAAVLASARDKGASHVEEIASREAASMGISSALAVEYLRDTLHFTLGRDECAGLRRFYELCVAHDLAPSGLERTIDECIANGCA
ncbi:MAG: menaquinone biosynthetic enzyme MqnA/MqnD family protein, partial [Candidatus Acidiferrales bacterium]